MSAAIDGGVETPKSRGVFARAFAKRTEPFEQGKFHEFRNISTQRSEPT